MATIKEIAEKVQVSISTVSRILNADSNLKVSSETRAKVIEIAEQLHYTKIATSTKNSLGTIAITHWYTKEVSVTDLYFRAIRWGAETNLRTAGYTIKRYIFNEELPDADAIDGIIAIGHYNKSQLTLLKELNKPLVVINQNTLHEGISCVSADYRQPVLNIIDYFFQEGHETIGLLTAKSTTRETDPREIVFINEMQARHKFQHHFVFQGDFTMESGYTAMSSAIEQLGDQLPTAFLSLATP